MDLWHLNNMKVILTLWTLNCVDCVPFLFPNFKKKRKDQISINMNIAIDFKDWFLNYVSLKMKSNGYVLLLKIILHKNL